MPINVTDVGQLTVAGRASGQQILNVFHFRRLAGQTGSVADADIPTIVGSFIGDWRLMIGVTHHTSYSVEVYRWRTLTGVIANPTPPPPTMFTEGPALDTVGGPLDVGLLGSDALPTFDAIGIQKLSDRAGRNYRGSFRLGPSNEPSSGGNSWVAGFVAGIQGPVNDVVLNVRSATFGQDFEMCIFSRTLALGAIVPFTDLRSLTAKVTGAKISNFVTSQVSRKQSLTSPT